jgi:hypothetical protein
MIGTATQTTNRATSHAFTLVLGGASSLTRELQDALFESGCDDALLGIRDGVVFLDFDRQATSFRDALLSAIADVERAAAGVSVVRVEPDDLVTAAEIARRSGRSREGIRQLVAGRRGPGGFPAPVANLTGRSPVWRWTDVARWLAEHQSADMAESSHAVPDSARLVAAINAALELRRHLPNNRDAAALLSAVTARPKARRS